MSSLRLWPIVLFLAACPACSCRSEPTYSYTAFSGIRGIDKPELQAKLEPHVIEMYVGTAFAVQSRAFGSDGKPLEGAVLDLRAHDGTSDAVSVARTSDGRFYVAAKREGKGGVEIVVDGIPEETIPVTIKPQP